MTERTIECPECAGDIPWTEGEITCVKCGASFTPKIRIHVGRHEYRNPILYAKAHLRAADLLLNSIS